MRYLFKKKDTINIRIKPPFIAKCLDDLANSPIDPFSLSHIFWGSITYIIFFAIFTIPLIINYLNLELSMIKSCSLIGTMVIAIAWEFFENGIAFKFKKKVDSLMNALYDIFFWVIGGIIVIIINDSNITKIFVTFLFIIFILSFYLIPLEDGSRLKIIKFYINILN